MASHPVISWIVLITHLSTKKKQKTVRNMKEEVRFVACYLQQEVRRQSLQFRCISNVLCGPHDFLTDPVRAVCTACVCVIRLNCRFYTCWTFSQTGCFSQTGFFSQIGCLRPGSFTASAGEAPRLLSNSAESLLWWKNIYFFPFLVMGMTCLHSGSGLIKLEGFF